MARRRLELWICAAMLAACSVRSRDNGPQSADGGADLAVVVTGNDPVRLCSADLQNVTDSRGNVIEQCAPDRGCGNGACINPCDAAKAARGAVGCDFWVATPPSGSGNTFQYPACYVVFLANNWTKPAQISVDYAGASLDVTKFAHTPNGTPKVTSWQPVRSLGLLGGEVAVLFLSSDPMSESSTPQRCPVPQAIVGPSTVGGPTGPDYTYGTGKGRTFHIRTDVPVTAYDMLPYGAGGSRSHFTGSTLLLPQSAWGTSYMAVGPPQTNVLQVVASVDNTTINVLPSSDLKAGPGILAAPAGTTTSYTLNAGEFIQWGVADSSKDGSGTLISSNDPAKPIAVNTAMTAVSTSRSPSETWGIHSKTSAGGGGESAHQQIPPTSALSSIYVGAPYSTRQMDLSPESVPYRIAGVADHTMLKFDPPVAGAPTELSLGQVIDFETDVPFVVSSQDATHPFYLAQMMPGGYVTNFTRPGATDPPPPGESALPKGLGDEEFVTLVPPAQFLSRYVFYTDPTYSTTTLTLVRLQSNGAFEDVNVDCLGVVGGWKPVGASGLYQTTDVDLVRSSLPVGSCSSGGIHTAHSAGPFGVIVWGTDLWVSYGYAGGGSLSTLNTVALPNAPL